MISGFLACLQVGTSVHDVREALYYGCAMGVLTSADGTGDNGKDGDSTQNNVLTQYSLESGWAGRAYSSTKIFALPVSTCRRSHNSSVVVIFNSETS